MEPFFLVLLIRPLQMLWSCFQIIHKWLRICFRHFSSRYTLLQLFRHNWQVTLNVHHVLAHATQYSNKAVGLTTDESCSIEGQARCSSLHCFPTASLCRTSFCPVANRGSPPWSWLPWREEHRPLSSSAGVTKPKICSSIPCILMAWCCIKIGNWPAISLRSCSFERTNFDVNV